MKNKEKNFISVVVYVRNDESIIYSFLENIYNNLLNNFNNSEIICVNDCSSDDSVEEIKRFSKKVKDVSISLLNMSSYYGVETCVSAGTDLSIGDFVYEFDTAEVDYHSDEMYKLYDISLQGYDVVSASPDTKQRLSSKVFYSIFKKYSKTNIMLSSERFRVLSRRAINRIKNINKTIPYRKPVYMNCGLNSMNYVYIHTSLNRKKETAQYRFNLAVDSLILFTNFGFTVSVRIVLFMLFIVFFMAIYTSIVYILGLPVAGWTTTIMFFSISFFGLFSILAIIIKYLQLLVDLSFKRSQYNFESIEKLTK